MITQKDVEIKTTFHPNGSLNWRQYFADGKISRHPGDGPANEVFNEKGQCVLRQYYVGGEINRNPADGPAHESFHDNGNVCTREYLVYGNLSRHPKDGPALESFSREKELFCSEYWLDGKRLTDAEIQAILNPSASAKPGPAPVARPEIFVMIDGKKYKVVEQDPDDIACPEEQVLAGVGRKV